MIYIHVNLWFNQGIQFHLPWMQMCINVHHFIRVNLLVIVECQGCHSLLAHRCPHIILRRLSVLALHSHSQDVTGRVHASWRSVLMFGKWTESQSLIAADVAGLLSAGIFSYRNFQQVISNATSSGDGNFSWYNSSAVVMSTCLVQITVGTSPRREDAVIANEEDCSSRSEMIWSMAAFFLK